MVSLNQQYSQWDFDDVRAMTEHLRRDVETAKSVTSGLGEDCEWYEWSEASAALVAAEDALLRGNFMARKFLVERCASWRVAEQDGSEYCFVSERDAEVSNGRAKRLFQDQARPSGEEGFSRFGRERQAGKRPADRGRVPGT